MVMVRYTGALPVLFAGRVGHHEPGDVFGLTDEEIESFTSRADIEVVDESASEPQDTFTEAEGEPVVPAEPVTGPEPAPTTPAPTETPEAIASS